MTTLKMTPADINGARLLKTHGRAVVVQFRGFWLCGGNRISQVTVRRLISAGLASEQKTGLVVPTDLCLTSPHIHVMDAVHHVGGGHDQTDRGSSCDVDDFTDGSRPWSPPDPRYKDGQPVPADVFFERTDR